MHVMCLDSTDKIPLELGLHTFSIETRNKYFGLCRPCSLFRTTGPYHCMYEICYKLDLNKQAQLCSSQIFLTTEKQAVIYQSLLWHCKDGDTVGNSGGDTGEGNLEDQEGPESEEDSHFPLISHL